MNHKNPRIAVIGTFDSKAVEYGYLIKEIKACGAEILTIDIGLKESRTVFAPDINVKDILLSGGVDMKSFHTLPRNRAMDLLLEHTNSIVSELMTQNDIDGFISMGGSGGTTLASAVYRELPLDMPKVLISTLAGTSRIGKYIEGQNITVINPVVDVSGINAVTRIIFKEAAGTIYGAAKKYYEARGENSRQKPIIAATMYGVTTPCVMKAKKWLEDKGYEVIVFHAVGSGGRAMEKLLRQNFFRGILDITTTEVAAEALGSLSGTAGPLRLDRTDIEDIPQVVSLGACDMVSVTDFEHFKGHQIYCHNDKPSHIRTGKTDMEMIGRYFAEKLNASRCKTALFIPLKGFSEMDRPEKELFDPEADKKLIETIKQNIDKRKVEVIELNDNVNDDEFALRAAKKLHELIEMEKKNEG